MGPNPARIPHVTRSRSVSDDHDSSPRLPADRVARHRRRRAGARRAGADRCVVAGCQLPLGRPDLPPRQPAPARAPHPGPREAAAARPLGHDAGPDLPVRAPEPRHRGAAAGDGLRHGPRPRRAGPRRLRVPGRHLLRGLQRHHRGHRGREAPVPAVLVPGRHPEPRRAGDARVDPRGRRARLLPEPRLRRGLRQPRPAGRGGGGRRRGRDRAAGHLLALEQVHQPGPGRRGAADPAPQRLQDREPDGPGTHLARRS